MARGDKSDKKTVTDLKNGKASEGHQVPVDGDKQVGHNSWQPSGESLEELYELDREVTAKIDDLKEKQRLATLPFREKIADQKKRVRGLRERLITDGYPAKELDNLLQERRLRQAADRKKDELDVNQRQRRDEMERVWKDFRNLPLGQAAEAAATAH